MATKKARTKRTPRKRAKKVSRRLTLDDAISGARANFLEFLKKADPDAPELKR